MRLFRRRDAGFTIIEVLVALTLLAAVILLVTRAFLTVLSVTSQGGRVTVATALAAKQLEAVRTRVEAQPDRTNWRNEFCAIAAQPTTVFAAPYCTNDANLTQDDRLRWVTVEVFFQGGGQPVARMTSAIMRGAYHR